MAEEVAEDYSGIVPDTWYFKIHKTLSARPIIKTIRGKGSRYHQRLQSFLDSAEKVNRKSTFLQLPQEVRDLIYEYVFTPTDFEQMLDGKTQIFKALPSRDNALSLVCKQMRREIVRRKCDSGKDWYHRRSAREAIGKHFLSGDGRHGHSTHLCIDLHTDQEYSKLLFFYAGDSYWLTMGGLRRCDGTVEWVRTFPVDRYRMSKRFRKWFRRSRDLDRNKRHAGLLLESAALVVSLLGSWRSPEKSIVCTKFLRDLQDIVYLLGHRATLDHNDLYWASSGYYVLYMDWP